MASRRQPTGDGQVRSISNLRVETAQMHSSYDIVSSNLTRGATGLLQVFSLIPRNARLPHFAARIDDGGSGNRREPDLDVDVVGASSAIERDFKAGRNGYSGHHTDRSASVTDRAFYVEIEWAGQTIYKGTISFNATFEASVAATAHAVDTVDALLIRAKKGDAS